MNSKQFALSLMLSIITALIGFNLGRVQSKTPLTAIPNNPVVKGSALFRSQTATIQGMINNIQSGKAYVTNIQGLSDSFPLASNWSYNDGDKRTQASASSQIKLPLNQSAIILLELIDKEYKVTSISLLPTRNLTSN